MNTELVQSSFTNTANTKTTPKKCELELNHLLNQQVSHLCLYHLDITTHLSNQVFPSEVCRRITPFFQ